MNVGVLDIDLCGPSAPRVFGVLNEQVTVQIVLIFASGKAMSHTVLEPIDQSVMPRLVKVVKYDT